MCTHVTRQVRMQKTQHVLLLFCNNECNSSVTHLKEIRLSWWSTGCIYPYKSKVPVSLCSNSCWFVTVHLRLIIQCTACDCMWLLTPPHPISGWLEWICLIAVSSTLWWTKTTLKMATLTYCKWSLPLKQPLKRHEYGKFTGWNNSGHPKLSDHWVSNH